jgi:hypothetical protein
MNMIAGTIKILFFGFKFLSLQRMALAVKWYSPTFSFILWQVSQRLALPTIN